MIKIALTCKIWATVSRRHGETMVTVIYVLCVLCVVVWASGGWCPPLAYDISYYGIVLGVGISIVVLDTHAILVKYLVWEYGGREKNDKSGFIVCDVCCKKQLSTTTILQ